MAGQLVPAAFMTSRVAAAPRDLQALDLQRALRRWCGSTRGLGPASPLRALVDTAVSLLALLELSASGSTTYCDDYALVPCRAAADPVLLVVTPWGATASGWWRTAVAEAVRVRARWSVVFTGLQLALFAPARAHSRRHVEIELDAAADDLSTAAAMRLLFHAEALGGSRAIDDLLDAAALHADAVCRSLRIGVLDAARHVLEALVVRERRRPLDEVFEQSLTVVYRLLFLLFAEARALVPVWHPVYRQSYSVESLRDAALNPSSVGLWDAMRAAARLAHAGCRAGNLEVTAFNGRLFAPARTPLAERRGLDDEAARHAVVALATRAAADGEGRERISYHDLGVEQLGAVYETLLDYTPHVETAAGAAARARRAAPLVSLRAGSGVRKDTGTFYTPQPIVDYLVREALAPLVANAPPEQILELKVLDPSMGSGAFLVGACQYLANAYEQALVSRGHCHPSDITDGTRASIRRQIAERCLFGVDLNPTAVQLARLSLWLTTLASDKPLSFLDHRLRVGDSLSGTWLSLLRTPPTMKRPTAALPLFPDAPADAIRQALPTRIRLAVDPNDTAAQVRDKERALAALTAVDAPLTRWMRVADLWCASWLAHPAVPAVAFASLADHVLTGRRCGLPGATVRELLDRAATTAAAWRPFHWELEFPEVFFDPSGDRRPDAGFDAVLGNPPWDMVRADAAAGPAARTPGAGPAALVRFARDSGSYSVRADGQVNRYQLFVDRAMALTRPGGQIGLVLPSGIFTDAGSGALRRLLFSRCDVRRVVGFDNRLATFPIHRGVRFVLLSAVTGRSTSEIACRFGEVDSAGLEAAHVAPADQGQSWFTTRVPVSLLEKLSGDDLAVPHVRSLHDLRIAERAASLFPPLGSRSGWNAHFGRDLNVTDDRAMLRTDGHGIPVLEGKLVAPFRAASDRVRWTVRARDAQRALGDRWRRARLAYRDVASATNRLTLIAAVLPAQTTATHTLFCLKEPMALGRQHLLCALMNSLVVNFLVRLRVATHVTTAIVERLAVPEEAALGGHAVALSRLSETLGRRDDQAGAAWLNAVVARTYQLTDDEFAHVLASFPLIDAAERTAMLGCFRQL